MGKNLLLSADPLTQAWQTRLVQSSSKYEILALFTKFGSFGWRAMVSLLVKGSLIPACSTISVRLCISFNNALFKGQHLKNSTYLLTSLQKAALPSLSKTLWQKYFMFTEERAIASWMCSCWKGTAETFRNNSWNLIISRCIWLLFFYKSETKLCYVSVLKLFAIFLSISKWNNSKHRASKINLYTECFHK